MSYLLFALAYSVFQPIWDVPDEPYHFGVVRYIQLHHDLPVATGSLTSVIDEFDRTKEYSQTPLSYLALAALLRPIRLPADAWFHPNPYVMWPDNPWNSVLALHRTDEGWPYQGMALFVHLARLASVAYGLVTVLAVYGLLRALTHRVADALFGTAWLAWTPGFLLASSRLNNDALATATSAMTIFFAARCLVAPRVSRWTLAALSLGLTAALLSKIDTLVLIPLVVLAAFAGGSKGDVSLSRSLARDVSRRVLAVLLVLLPPLGFLGLWWFRYGRTFASRTAGQAGFGVLRLDVALQTFDASRVLEALIKWNGTWWAGVGIGVTVGPSILYVFLGIVLLVLVGAGLVSLFRPSTWPAEAVPGASRRAAVALIAIALALFYATIARQAFPSVGLDANARFTLPIAPILALLAARGARVLPLAGLRRPLAGTYLAGLFGFAVAVPLLFLPRLPHPTIPARFARDAQEEVAPALAHFSSGVDLLAVDGLPTELTPDKAISIDLRWRDGQPVKQNFVASVQLVRLPDQQRVAGTDAVPDEQTFPPVMWQTNEIVDESSSVAIPSRLEAGRYALKIDTYYWNQDKVQPIPLTVNGVAVESVLVGSWLVLPDTSGLAQSHPTSARFGPALQLRGYAEDWTADRLNLTLYWEASQQLSRPLVVSVQVLDANGKLVAQNDSVPDAGLLPTTLWPTNQVVRDDHTVMTGRAPGSQVIVVVYDQQTLQRLSVAGGPGPADHLVLP